MFISFGATYSHVKELSMRKIIIALLLVFYSIASKSQTSEFIIMDSSTTRPVSSVNVFSFNTLEGTISNKEGRIKIPTNDDVFILSHVGYQTKEVAFHQGLEDSIYLIPNTIELQEVSISNVDIEKKLQYVLENYDQLYETSPALFESTYKESLKVSGEMARLSQVQLQWWNKSYKYNFDRPFDKQNQMSVEAIDYSKILDNRTILANGGFLDNKNFFQFVHLNYYPVFLSSFGRDIHITAVENQEQVMKITFDAAVEVDGETVSRLKDCELYFDNETGAILELYFQIIYENNPVEGFSRTLKIPYTSVMKKHELRISFNKVPDSKLMLSSFYSHINADVQYQDKIEQLEINQNIFITKSAGNKPIRRKDRIDLTIPFYESFPTNKQSDSKILLSQEELAFIEGK